MFDQRGVKRESAEVRPSQSSRSPKARRSRASALQGDGPAGSVGGLRFGELAALTRGDIDLRTGTVSVNETVTTLQSGERFPGPPKSEAGRRSVAIPSTILPAISAHLETVATEPTALLFPAPEGGYLQPHNFRHRVWLPALKATGLSFRFHDLRHCALTLAELSDVAPTASFDTVRDQGPIRVLGFSAMAATS